MPGHFQVCTACDVRLIDGKKLSAREVQERFAGNQQTEGSLFFDSVVSISVEVAEELARTHGDMPLDGRRILEPDVVKALERHQHFRYLDGVESLSAEAARAIATHEKPLWFGGLKKISLEAAEGLSMYASESLTLGGLTAILAEIMKVVRESPGVHLPAAKTR